MMVRKVMTRRSSKTAAIRRASGAKLVGGALCLDLVNTVGWRRQGLLEERLTDYGELMDWGLHAGALDAAERRALRRLARERPDAAEAVLERARALREASHRILSRLIGGKEADAGDLARINAELAAAPPRRSLERAGRRLRWQGPAGPERLDRMLPALAWSTADLLAGAGVRRVKRCEAEDCGWLFLDQSRNMSRRWCQMEICGNREKAKRHYRRRRSAG
jgi:predicted RNA-binding Zn ribbon-like protein